MACGLIGATVPETPLMGKRSATAPRRLHPRPRDQLESQVSWPLAPPDTEEEEARRGTWRRIGSCRKGGGSLEVR
eukprot:923367-Pyramimonas_sp.AAC.2